MNTAPTDQKAAAPADSPDHIKVTLDVMLERRGMSLGELSRQTGITTKNLGELKNGKKTAIWFLTLASVCRVLECQPGDLLTYEVPAEAKENEEAAE